MITVDLDAKSEIVGEGRSCPDIARKLIREGADPQERIDFVRSGTRVHLVRTLGAWAKTQHIANQR